MYSLLMSHMLRTSGYPKGRFCLDHHRNSRISCRDVINVNLGFGENYIRLITNKLTSK